MKPRVTTTFGALPVGAWFHIPHDQFIHKKISETHFTNGYTSPKCYLHLKDTVELIEDDMSAVDAELERKAQSRKHMEEYNASKVR